MRTRSGALALTSLIVAMAACGSSTGGAGGSGSGAGGGDPVTTSSSPIGLPPPEQATFFEQKVYPMLIQACGICHAAGNPGGPTFLTGNAEETYKLVHVYNDGSLIAPPNKNLLLNKDEHEGPALDSPQRALIAQWISLEYAGISDTAPPLNMYNELASFAACMDKTAFGGTVGQVFMSQTDGGCTCASCHAAAEAKGSGGQIVFDPDLDATFSAAQKFPGVMTLVQPVVGDTGLFAGLTQSHRITSKGTDPTPQSQGMPNPGCSCQTALALKMNGIINVADPTYCHPGYDLPIVFQDQIEAFVDMTLSNVEAKACPTGVP
jgi:hypothetical protein